MSRVTYALGFFLLSVCLVYGVGVQSASPVGNVQSRQNSAPAHQRPPLEIKTLKIGMSVADLKRLFSSSATCYGPTNCQVDTRIAEKAASFNVSFNDDKLENAYLSKYESSNAEELAEAFRQKYGDPDVVSTRVLQNGYGAKFECPVYMWNFPEGTLTVAQFRPETRAIMQVEITSSAMMKRQVTEHKKAIGDV